MTRAPFQVLVLLHSVRNDGRREYAVFQRSDGGGWQGVAGGGERGEMPAEAAGRELMEEAGVRAQGDLMALDSIASIPAYHFPEADWGARTYVIPEYSFAVGVGTQEIVLSSEHSAVEWLSCDEAHARFTYDSNRTALWELAQRIGQGDV